MKLVNLIKKINPYHFYSVLILGSISALITYANLGSIKEFIGDDAGVGYHFSNSLIKYISNMWDSYSFPGRSNVISTIALIHIGLIHVLNQLGSTSISIDRIFYFSFYFISGMGMYCLINTICNISVILSTKKLWLSSITGALFFMLNNLTMILFSFPPTNYVYSYVLLPWVFLFYLKDFHLSNNLLKILAFAVLILLLFSGNPSNTISIIIFIFIYEIFFRTENKILNNWGKFIPFLILIILLTSYIYLPILGNKTNPYGVVLKSDNRASISFSSVSTSLTNLFRMRGHHSQEAYIFNEFLLKGWAIFSNYILLIISFIFLLTKKNKGIHLFIITIFVIFILLTKAEHAPYYWINEFLYNNIPLFEMYRASYFKFIYFCVFSFSIMISFGVLEIERILSYFSIPIHIRKIILIIPLLLIVYSAEPFFLGKVVRDIHKTSIPAEYHRLNTVFSRKKLDISVLSLPQLPSGQILSWGNGDYYAGYAHTDMFILDRPVWSSGWFMPKPILSNSLKDYKKILDKTNVKYILLHKDIPESYLFEVNMKGYLGGQKNFKKLNKQIIATNEYDFVENNSFYSLFQLKEYLPHIYIQKNNITTSDRLQKTPILEYKKINPTKYRVVVHKAQGEFPLVFSESFHEEWKSYLVPSRLDLPRAGGDLKNYKILDENREDQASGTEVQDFIDKGWISTIGDGKEKEIKHMKWGGNKEVYDYTEKYNIDFISKNFQDTIQNDNLPNGPIFETWFKKPIEDNKNHVMVNGYANSWMIDIEKICGNDPSTGSGQALCIKNTDGSYDFEIVVEFWPQRFFYIGLAISGVTLFGCISYLIYSWIKKRKSS